MLTGALSAVPFYGRHEPLATLQHHLTAVRTSGTARLLTMRGRRQVGKSTLLAQFIRATDAPYVYTTGIFQAPRLQHLQAATHALSESLRPLPGTAALAGSAAQSWSEWLSRIALAAAHGPVIVVLDEFPWLAAADPTLEGVLQREWDHTLEHLPVLLILVGSDVHMIAQLGTHGRPLFGRIRPVVIPPLSPGDIAAALPNATAASVFDAYLITGGYPRLVREVAEFPGNLQTYVQSALSDVYSPLVSTARFTLEAEFPSPVEAYTVLAAIGSSEVAHPRFGDILSQYGAEAERKSVETAITRALKTLSEEKQLITQEVPAWAKPTGRLRRWRITDTYLRFWFRYIHGNVERISRGRADIAWEYFQRDWLSWRGRAIEPIVRESVSRLATSDERFAQVHNVAAWWTRDGATEVDVVAMGAQHTLALGSIKWGSITAYDMRALQTAKTLVPRAEQAQLLAISPAGTLPPGADLALGATDLLATWS